MLSSAVESGQSLEGVLEVSDIVVIGAGPVGQHFIKKILELDANKKIKWFGDEAYQPYDRVSLTPLLGGKIGYEDIFDKTILEHVSLEKVFNTTIVSINREEKYVVDQYGFKHPYRKLVLATGSSPHIPSIPGVKAKRVYRFRNLNDVCELQARTASARKIVVVGAGLLGLEAARAMLRHHTDVMVVQQGHRLMNRQLDERASDLLKDKLEKDGVVFRIGAGVREILTDSKDGVISSVKGVLLHGGEVLDCDTVIFCTGIKPNIKLAIDASIAVGQGIKVNQNLQTNDSDVYAIGECAQFKDEILGLVAPGIEQASVAAHNICNRIAQYQGFVSASTLKVTGVNVFSVGDIQEEFHDRFVSAFKWQGKNGYRKIYLRKGVIIGAIAIGSWKESAQLREYIRSERRIPLFRRALFLITGNVFDEGDSLDISTWPEMAVVCNCKSVNRASISAAYDSGCRDVKTIGACTGAGTVCGSCLPLLENFTGEKTLDKRPEENAWWLSSVGVLSLLMSVCIVLLTPIAYSESVQQQIQIDRLWIESLYKQASGFALIFLISFTIIFSLSKRWNGFRLGRFVFWRNMHATLGVFALFILLAHTGMHLGVNLNQWLMSNFIALSIAGGLSALVNSKASLIPVTYVNPIKRAVNWVHIISFWPLPVLLSVHVISVYYF